MLTRFLAVLAAAALAAASVRAADIPLVLDHTQSHVDVVVKATVDSFTGRLTAYDAVIGVAPNGTLMSARLDFHFRDVATGKPKRDRAMHEWQHSKQYPDGRFEALSLTPVDGSTVLAKGRLTLHGVTNEIEFPVSVARDGSRYAIDGDATIDTRTFGLPVIRMLGVLKVDPLVHVRFHLQGRTATALLSRR